MRTKLLCTLIVVSLMAVLFGGLAQPDHSSAQGTDFSAIANSQNQFAFDFYQQIRDDNEDNLIFSAYSIWQALAMVYAGARGNTESQMATALHYDLPQAELHSMIAGLNADIASRAVPPPPDPANPTTPDVDLQPLQLNVANALWGQDGAPFEQAYLDILAQQYQSEMHTADFANGSLDAIADEINAWVADQTQDKIPNALDPDALTTATRLVLANAIYFKGSWSNGFQKGRTEDAPFYLLDNSEVTVSLMYQKARIAHVFAEQYDAVSVDYFGDTAAMLLILPHEGQFEAFESAFNQPVFNDILNQMARSEIILLLPQFEYETTLNLIPALVDRGMFDAFDPCAADFSGSVTYSDGEGCIGNFYITNAMHKAYVKVDEGGTEAAAVTIISESVLLEVEPEPPGIRFDRPFLYAIYDKPTGTILFMGRVMNPTME